MPKYLTEFLGTMLLVFVIGLASAHAGPSGGLAIGIALMALVATGAHISGAHYNPAVTLAVALSGTIPSAQAVRYVLFQLAGAAVGAVIVHSVTGEPMIVQYAANTTITRALAVEMVFTFMLTLTILNVALHPKASANQYAPLAIGAVVCAAATAGGPISGGAFNPAVGFAALIGAISKRYGNTFAGQNVPLGEYTGHLWLYLAGPCLGAVLAQQAFRLQLKQQR
jgi:aquaporin Z